MATVLYNDRINTYRKMKQLDELLEKERNAQAVADMAELRIRNLQAFRRAAIVQRHGQVSLQAPIALRTLRDCPTHQVAPYRPSRVPAPAQECSRQHQAL